MTDQRANSAAQLRYLADKIDAGEVASVDVHHDMQPSTVEPMSPRQMVYRITVTMPPDPLNLGYRIDEIPIHLPPIGWPYEVHADNPPSQRVHVIGPRASAWVNVGPSHMEGHCIVAVIRDDTGTRYRAVQGPVWTEAASSDVMPTITQGWHPVAYVELWRSAGAVVAANIMMSHRAVHREETPQ